MLSCYHIYIEIVYGRILPYRRLAPPWKLLFWRVLVITASLAITTRLVPRLCISRSILKAPRPPTCLVPLRLSHPHPPRLLDHSFDTRKFISEGRWERERGGEITCFNLSLQWCSGNCSHQLSFHLLILPSIFSFLQASFRLYYPCFSPPPIPHPPFIRSPDDP